MSEFIANDERAVSRYQLSEEERMARTRQFLDGLDSRPSQLACYRVKDEAMKDVARTIECEVFERHFGNDAAVMADLYGPYEEASEFFVLADSRIQEPNTGGQVIAKPVGALRVIKNSSAGLMTLNTLPPEVSSMSPTELAAVNKLEDLERCWDVGTIAVLPEHRSQDAAILLYRALYKAACADNIQDMVSIIDARLYEKMTKYLGMPFHPLEGTGPFAYEGSMQSYAVRGHIPDFYGIMKKHMRWTVRGWLAHGALRDLVDGENDRAIHLG